MRRSSFWIIVVACVILTQYFYNDIILLLDSTSPTDAKVKQERLEFQKQAKERDSKLQFNGFKDYEVDWQPINPFPFKPVLVPTDPCSDPDLYIFMFIYTAPGNADSRQLIRETWGDTSQYVGTKFAYLFFMGLEENATRPANAIIRENERYGDIYVENYLDSYYNLSRKGMSGMRYAHRHCGHVRRIVRSDDDVLIDIFHLIKFFRSEEKDFTHNAFLCRPQPNDPLRDKGSKWYVSWEEWPSNKYPKVCNGFVYIMSPDVCGKLFDIALNTPYFKFEDVYITGSLMEKANITKVNIGSFYDGKFYRFNASLHNTPEGEDFPYIFTLTHKSTAEEVREVWNFIKSKYY